MCGILGAYSPGGIDRARLESMLDLLDHRGPDARAIWSSPDRRVALGHARLKILDLSDAANQPMVSPDGRWVLAFNGEIVNFTDLRRRYTGPWQFRTSGDSEVLLATFAQRGMKAMHDWVGMFAFALLDLQEGTLLLVRDRFGIKPLYWIRSPSNGFAFASEIPPLLPFLSSVAADEDTIRTYLELGLYDFGSRSFFKDVQAIEPGSAVVVDLSTGSLKSERWYHLAEHLPDLSHEDDFSLVARGEELVEQAVHDHLVADVAVGLNLSGGVDSATLAGVARGAVGNIHGFTQDFEEPYSEAHYARQAAQGCPIHIVPVTQDYVRDILPEVVRRQAEPFGGVTVCGYQALYEAADEQGITVLLDGNGVDEAFLGYTKYAAMYSQLPPTLDQHAIAPSIDGTMGVRGEAMADRLRSSATLLECTIGSEDFADRIKAAAAIDLLAAKIPRGLRFNDRMSMSSSKELRVPFLDHRLVEFGFAVPTSKLLCGSATKSLFRKIARRWIPEQDAWAPKRSVQSPQREWLANQWSGVMRETLTSRSFAERGWVDPKRAYNAYVDYLAGNRTNSFYLWQWLNLELWAQAFLDGG